MKLAYPTSYRYLNAFKDITTSKQLVDVRSMLTFLIKANDLDWFVKNFEKSDKNHIIHAIFNYENPIDNDVTGYVYERLKPSLQKELKVPKILEKPSKELET